MSDMDAISAPPARKRRKRKPEGRKFKPLPDAQALWELFEFKPLTGELIWRKRQGQSYRLDLVGKPAGHLTLSGYTNIGLSDKGLFMAHRLIWRWVTGADPGAWQIDHVNLNRNDNRFWNLRLADQSQQGANAPKRKTWGGSPPSSRLKGVRIYRDKKGYESIVAQIKVNGTVKYLGAFSTEEAAYAAYCEAAKKYHGSFARTK